MPGFKDQTTALSFRDWLRRFVTAEIERLRPKPRYGVVITVNTTTKKCQVLLNGDPSGSEITVPYGSVLPAVDDVVRVAGASTDRYIDDVLP